MNCMNIGAGTTDHIFSICLLGNIDGEVVKRSRLTPCSNTTVTRINIKAIIQRLVNLKKEEGFTQGPAILY